MADTHKTLNQWHLEREKDADGKQIWHEPGETCDVLAVLKKFLPDTEDPERQLADLENARAIERLPQVTETPAPRTTRARPIAPEAPAPESEGTS